MQLLCINTDYYDNYEMNLKMKEKRNYYGYIHYIRLIRRINVILFFLFVLID